MKKTLIFFGAVLLVTVQSWGEMVSYVDEKSETQMTNATIIATSDSRVTWTAGWYAVTNDVTISGGADCSGAVKLILADGAKLTINGVAEDNAGIAVTGDGNSFAIYGQTNGTGELDVAGGSQGAGIGGGYNGDGANITINGGTVTAKGGSWCAGAGIGGGAGGSGSNITINGGTVMAKGGDQSAGIGGGYEGNGTNITINGGTVTAKGGQSGAGIGGGVGGNGGGSGSDITINGGVVTATGGSQGAGIGSGGWSGKASNITINGGVVTATGGSYGAGIGGGGGRSASDITINGGTVTATGGEESGDYGSGIGGGYNGTGSAIYVKEGVVVWAGSSPNPTEIVPFVSPTTDIAASLAGKRYAVTETSPQTTVSYVDENGETQTTNAYIVFARDARATWNTNWYVVTNDTTIVGGAACSGAVKLILADGAKLTINGVAEKKAGIAVTGGSNSFAVYGQANGTGMLDVTGGKYSAGIGGDSYVETSIGAKSGKGANITINGGEVAAAGGYEGAGIGGGSWGEGSNITINGGEVTAMGGFTASGIGGGWSGDGSGITINGGWVMAMGGYDGAGIGGGSLHPGKDITINGGIVTAQGGVGAAGIGGGGNGAGSGITITGGSVTATGGKDGAGIGGGLYGGSGSIYVADSVILTAGDSANPTEVISHASSTTDISSSLAGKRYAMAKGSIGVSTWKQVKAYLEAGVSVWLVANVTQDVSSVGINGKTVTLDLNGFTIFGSTETGGGIRLLVLMNGANLTLTDSSDAKTGAFDGQGTCHDVNGGCVYVCENCTFTMNGGTITNCLAAQGGAIYNCGGFVLNGGKITGNTATEWGGGVFIASGATMSFSGGEISCNAANGTTIGGGGIVSSGRMSMTGGTITGNVSGNPASTAIYSNLDDSDAIYGGVIDGTICRAEAGDLVIFGGVFDRDQTSLLTSGRNCTGVGSNWIVGTDIASDANNELMGGTYTFCPTNAEYVAAGVAVAETIKVRENAEEPKTWTLCLTTFLAKPTQIAHATATVYTNGVLSAETSFGSGLWYAETNGAATVVYRTDTGYCFAGGATMITNTLDTTVNPAANEGRIPVAWGWTIVDYVDEWGMDRTTNACIVVADTSRVIWDAGWYVVDADVTIAGGADCFGAVNLILADDATLTIRGVTNYCAGIAVSGGSDSFTVYGQAEGTGVLDVKGGIASAGIGGGKDGDGANITINGGTVTATGSSSYGAGIGGGYKGAGSNITVNAGRVTAMGGATAAGIGGGVNGDGSNITINGGVVTATGGIGLWNSVGIGAGSGGSSANIFVTDNMILKAGDSKDPTEVIPLASPKTDVSSLLAGKKYVTAEEWMAVCYSWARIKTNLEAGNNVRLGGDVDQGELEGVDIWCKQTVMLDLNGFKLTGSTAEGEAYRPFTVGPGHFTLTDTKGGGVVDGRGVINQVQGSLIWIREGDASFTLAGGTITGFAAQSAGGAVSVDFDSSFTMTGGVITNCSSENEGGAVHSFGTVTMTGGAIMNCSAGEGGAIYNQGMATVNGGVFVGNSAEVESTALFGDKSAPTIVNGGVSDSALIGEKKASGKDCTQVGDLFIVGTNIACDVDNRLTAGTYTFNPTNAEYVAAGVEIADDVYLTKNEGTPLMWTLLGRTIIEVPYVDGNGQMRTTNAEVVVPYISRETWEEGWYVVTNDVTITGGVDCFGAVKLILADGAKLTIRDVADNKAGIGVSGDGNSFTIYAQAGGSGALTVTGGKDGAGIGGGLTGSGSGITINGGWVTATGGENASGIGGGHGGAFSGIYVANNVIIRAGNSANPTEMIPHASPTTDIASSLAGKRYAKTEMPIEVSTWAALKSNLEAGNGVRLMENVTQDVQGVAISGKMVLLDLNGFTILGSTETAEAYRPFTLSNGANLTLTDYSTGRSGTIDGQKVTRGYVGGCVYVGEGCAFAMNGGTVTNFVADCGGAVDVENGGTFNLSGGTITGNASTRWGGGVFIVSGATMSFSGGEITCNTANGEIGGGGICSSGKLTMTGGRIVGNQSTDNFASTAIYSNLDDSDAIYGGVIDGTICRAEAGDLVIFGGVFGCDQTANLASGKTCVQVGANWIVGTNIACDANNRLTDGSYTFCPTNALYVAAGVEVSEVAEVRESEVEPKAWSVSLTTFVAAPTQFAHMTAVVCTNGFLSSESAPGSGLWYAWTNETATVIYTTDPGYRFEGGATAATNNLDTTVNPAVNKDDPPELLLPEVEYVDEKGVRKIAGAHIVMTSSSRVTWTAGWYAVTNDVTITGGAGCSGTVKLILADGAKLTINGVAKNKAGIAVGGGSDSFTVYGQAEGTGSLEVPGGYCAAGIGGGCYCSGANITINGGTVTATGSGAGIGGGLFGSGSNITINGGKVTAAGDTGAGIGGGGGREGSNITINGGVVTATGGANSAGIGGGSKGKGSNITINGGTVTATGGGSGGDSGGGAGIGGGSGHEGANITINGGVVTATGGEKGGTYGAGIGGGSECTGWSIFAADNVCVKAGDSANPTEVIPHASITTDIASLLAGKRYATAVMVITYPSYLEGKSEAVKAKFDVWAVTFGSRDPDGVYTNAFLLNVATNNQTAAEEAFAFGSIAVTNGVVDVELPKPLAPSTSFNGDVWLQCATNLPAADWKDVESGRYIDEKGAFLRSRIDFEHALMPESFPTSPEGTKTLKVFAR